MVVVYHVYLTKDADYALQIRNDTNSMMYHLFLIMFFPIVLFLALSAVYLAYVWFVYIVESLINVFK